MNHFFELPENQLQTVSGGDKFLYDLGRGLHILWNGLTDPNVTNSFLQK